MVWIIADTNLVQRGVTATNGHPKRLPRGKEKLSRYIYPLQGNFSTLTILWLAASQAIACWFWQPTISVISLWIHSLNWTYYWSNFEQLYSFTNFALGFAIQVHDSDCKICKISSGVNPPFFLFFFKNKKAFKANTFFFHIGRSKAAAHF